jgi:hypothetical protein
MILSVALVLVIAVVLVVVAAIVVYRGFYDRRAARFGYASRAQYMAAVPQTDAEKREAVDQALKGLAICILGLFFPPLLLVGLLPLFIGGRKMAWSSMGLGLADDLDSRGQ